MSDECLAIDIGGISSRNSSTRLGSRTAPPAEDQEAVRLVRQHTTMPRAVGAIHGTVRDYQRIDREQLIDYARSAVPRTRGIAHQRAALDYAEQNQVTSVVHGPTDISPVRMAAAMHLGLAIHNFCTQGPRHHGAKTDGFFPQPVTWNDGFLHPGEKPGSDLDLSIHEASM